MKKIVLTVVALGFLGQGAYGAELYVPSATYTTIQAAINAAKMR